MPASTQAPRAVWHETVAAIGLEALVSTGLAALAGVLYLFDGFPLQSLGISAAVALTSLLSVQAVRNATLQRLSLVWLAIPVGLALAQASAWVLFLASTKGADSSLALGLVATVVALIPLVYWLPGMLLALLLTGLGAWLMVPPPVPLWLGAVMLPTVGLALLFQRQLLEQRRFESLERDNSGKLDELRSEYRDIQERLRYEQERLASCRRELAGVRELADQAGQAKTEFLATISHEIRTPLNGILPTLDMLQSTSLDDEQQRYVRAASSSSRHLLRIINDLLDFARAESGKLQLESIEVDLKELVQSVLDLMEGSAERKGLSLRLRWDERLPQIVRADPIRLRQILANLLSNAIKFTEQGGVELQLEQVDSGRRELTIRFSVADTGIGLSRDEVRNLFSSFTQADASTTRKHGGTGLGLAICRRLVELMGGQIGVRSLPGQGSTFWFELPLRRSAQDVPAARKSLEGLRVMSAIRDRQLAARVANDLERWRVNAQQVPSVEIMQRLHDTAALGKSWACECLLLDDQGSDQSVIPILRGIHADVLLKTLRIVVITRSSELAARLHDEFSVYVLTGIYKSEALHRLLKRLFDVAGTVRNEPAPEALLDHFDLNVDQESILVPDNIEPVNSRRTQGRVLLAEDNPVNLGVVRRVLTRLDMACTVAENGQQALDLLRRDGGFDMVLMDCQMPVMDGYEATRQWRAHERGAGGHLPIVAMTANAMPGDREKCLEAGMDDYLAKPVSIGELRAMLDRWVGGKQASISMPKLAARPVKAPDGADRRMLDRAILRELREVMDDGFETLVQTFLAHSPELMDSLQKASRAGDVDAMVAPAHSLKSSSANMGAMRLSALARELEMAAREGRRDEALAAYRRMPAVFLATCAALRSELAGE